MKRHPALVLLVVGFCVVLVSGCVPYRRYDELKGEYARLKKINADLAAKYNHVVREYSVLSKDGQLTDVWKNQVGEKTRRISELESLISEIEDSRREIIPFSQDAADQIGHGVHVTRDGAISIGQDVLFAAGVADLKGSATSVLDGLAKVLGSVYSGEIFHIVGHTDNTPLKSTRKVWKTNVRLGFERAYRVFTFLSSEHSMPESQFVLHSYGYLNPVDPSTQDTSEGRARNRRVEIYRAGTKL
jgi:flagellar motor protein MotB